MSRSDGAGGTFLQFDEVPLAELPRHAPDDRRGDHVALLEDGLLVVRGGRATFAPYADVLGAIEYAGRAYVLVPRRPPRAPWIEISRDQIDGDVASFVARLHDRGFEGGYRSAVRRRRQNVPLEALASAIRARQPVPGALEVPSTIVLGREYPGLAAAQFAIFALIGTGGYVAWVALCVALAFDRRSQADADFVTLLAYPLTLGAVVVAGLVVRAVGQRWRAKVDARLPRQRVLVLAPDGCVVGFASGVRALAWPSIGRFAVERETGSDARVLAVYDASERRLGDIAEGWLDAPVELVVRIADAYREAALAD